jgi:hypothetical protein
MMQSLAHQFWDWMKLERYGVFQLMAGLTAMLWALWLAMPWNVFGTSNTYHAMGIVAPEWVWAALFASVGMVVLVGGLQNRSRLRRLGLLGLSSLWAFAAVMFAVGNYHSTAAPIYFVLSVRTGLLYLLDSRPPGE